ncbi:Zn-dependent alcohol dehydrogenase [Corynebacterium genitalium ATCC 33030]|nr:Zn-dependent alcohol dehydrogenase [Corynebacterium genitalium]UUA88462.1 Zn-dependent alcohol dehydrogenase [Corynebacterium genitalium ATCC 33030]
MKALTWQGKRTVSVEDVPDPKIIEPTDAIIRVTSTAICGSDLHLYEVLGPFMDKGDVIGHEPMGIVEEVGSAVTNLKPGDRVVVPFTVSCGHCFMCERGFQSQCETTQVKEYDKGATLFGYSRLYGSLPGGQAEYLRVPHADYGPIKVPSVGEDERYLFLSDVLPTAWQGVKYAGVPDGGTLAVLGLGPIGQMATRIGAHFGYRVIGVDPVAERRAMAARHGIEVIEDGEDVVEKLQELCDGRGSDSIVDAVGMEAHGSPVGGVYGGMKDPMPMMTLFDKQIQMRMGQCNVRNWTDDILPLVDDPSDPLGVLDLKTHTAPLDDAPAMYEKFQKKEDGCIKVVLKP